MVNWEFFDNQTPTSARQLVDELQAGKAVTPSRGASSVATFQEVSRVLAGFDDGRGGEGVGAAGATLEGLKVARQHGWAVEGLYDGKSSSSNGSGGQPASGGTAAVEQIAEEHVADPAAPSASDASSAGQTGRAPRKRTTKRKDG
jgi:NADH-quinone oxidoreductase subunit E